MAHQPLIRKLNIIAVTAVALGMATACLVAASGADSAAVNEANNPLTPKITLNFHNYYEDPIYGINDQYIDSFLIRNVMPHKLGGLPQMLRSTLPIVLAPGENGAQVGGLGDLNLVDLALTKAGPFEVGLGPQFTLPTATRDETGTGKWQIGVGSILISPQKWGLIGTLITWQTSFAGESDRPTQNNLTIQPLILYNLPKGWYLRSTAGWNFQLNYGHSYSILVGFGLGKVIVLKNGTSVNAFIEPQWTVAHHGVGVPQFQLFIGVNFQFPLHLTKK